LQQEEEIESGKLSAQETQRFVVSLQESKFECDNRIHELEKERIIILGLRAKINELSTAKKALEEEKLTNETRSVVITSRLP
jgi:hypothetical protein